MLAEAGGGAFLVCIHCVVVSGMVGEAGGCGTGDFAVVMCMCSSSFLYS